MKAQAKKASHETSSASRLEKEYKKLFQQDIFMPEIDASPLWQPFQQKVVPSFTTYSVCEDPVPNNRKQE